MATGFLQNGIDLHLVCINTKKHFKDDEKVPTNFKLKSHYQSIFHNTNTIAIGALTNLLSSKSYFVSRFYFKEFEESLITLLQKNTFDVIQLEGVFMGVYLPTIRKYSKAKLVLRAHNVEHFIWNRHVFLESNSLKKAYFKLQNKRLKRFEISVFKNVDAIVTITSVDATAIKKLGCTKPIFTSITGVNIEEYQKEKNIKKRKKTLFYFGSMDWLPNNEAVFWFLNNCWEKVHKAVPEAKFVVAGRGMPASIKKLIAPNLLLVENVPNAFDFYQKHEIMIVPLWSGSGIRIKIIEGMAHGKAIVSTSIGAEGIGYTHNKNILIADTADDFSEAVTGLLLNANKREQLEIEASSFANENFDNTRVVGKLIEFYKSILNA